MPAADSPQKALAVIGSAGSVMPPVWSCPATLPASCSSTARVPAGETSTSVSPATDTPGASTLTCTCWMRSAEVTARLLAACPLASARPGGAEAPALAWFASSEVSVQARARLTAVSASTTPKPTSSEKCRPPPFQSPAAFTTTPVAANPPSLDATPVGR